MFSKKISTIALLAIASFLSAQDDETTKVKLYGFVRNDFYYNSRQNMDYMDGTFHMYPKPMDLDANKNDKNAIPQAEMLSIYSRLGLDYSGTTVFGAKSTGKIEADFAGNSSNYYLVRIMHAYGKLNWANTELLIGQTWHPLAGSLMPCLQSVNQESPFQPFNRSPQVRIKQSLGSSFSITAAGIYQMQYTNYGEDAKGAQCLSPSLMKNAILPDLYLGAEYKSSVFTFGIGGEMKTIKPLTLVLPTSKTTLTSKAAMAYSQLNLGELTLKAKIVYGQNLSDQLMLGGYGMSASDSSTYTNFNTGTAWCNAIYGKKIQVGLFGGVAKNYGTESTLATNVKGVYETFGYGTDRKNVLDMLYRIKPYMVYNLPNFRFELQYDYTKAFYDGAMSNKGVGSTAVPVENHRVVAIIAYLF